MLEFKFFIKNMKNEKIFCHLNLKGIAKRSFLRKKNFFGK